MAKAKGTRVTQKEAARMYELYQQLGCYKAVGKKMRRSPDTVSRHIAIYEASRATAQAIIRKDINPLLIH